MKRKVRRVVGQVPDLPRSQTAGRGAAPRLLLSLLALVIVAVGAPLIGSTHVSLTRALAGVSPDHEILFYARLPRVLLALLAGAALSVTGVLFQCMLRDPLAEPYTLGVSSGSSVGTVIAISLGWRLAVIPAILGAAAV